MDKLPTYKLNNGLSIPVMGLGLWKMQEGDEAEQSIVWALEAGYRLIDTAKIYGNEAAVGRGIKKSGVPREQIFVTTKLWNDDQGYDSTLAAIDESLRLLDLDYVDLYLMHWPFAQWPFDLPGPNLNKREETWKAMEQIYQSGKAKAIGVANYTIKHLQEMPAYAKVLPAVNQVEFHPFLYQSELLDYCRQHSIQLEAYCPLVHGEKLQDERVTAIAQKYNRSNAQVLIRWSLQHGCLPIPKSTHQERLRENINVFDFELSDADMQALDALNENFRVGRDPNQVIE